jgi:hypothetical protein
MGQWVGGLIRMMLVEGMMKNPIVVPQILCQWAMVRHQAHPALRDLRCFWSWPRTHWAYDSTDSLLPDECWSTMTSIGPTQSRKKMIFRNPLKDHLVITNVFFQSVRFEIFHRHSSPLITMEVIWTYGSPFINMNHLDPGHKFPESQHRSQHSSAPAVWPHASGVRSQGQTFGEIGRRILELLLLLHVGQVEVFPRFGGWTIQSMD